jgi:LysR family transcriptional regulator, regulator for genes of the gallate degradation pathway
MNRLERSVPSLMSLLTIVEHGSINRAAEALNISQPALTRSITKLEQTLHAPLLERSARGVTLTEFGHTVVERARAIKAELRNTLNDVEALRGNAAGEIRLGATPMILAHFLPPALQALHQDAPLVAIRVSEGSRPSLLRQLRLGDLDMVVSTAPYDEEESDVAQEPLFDMELAVVVRPDHALSARARHALAELAAQPWILPRADSSLHRRVDRAFRAAGVNLSSSSIEVSSPEATKALVLATDLLAILPRLTVQKELLAGELVTLQGDWEFERRTVAAFYRPGGRRAPGIRKLAEHLKRRAPVSA